MAEIVRPNRNSYIITDDDGQLHCDNGPAVVYSTGKKEWWVHGKQHRDDGPAVEFRLTYDAAEYNNEYWLNGVQYGYGQWYKMIPNKFSYKWKVYWRD